VGPIQETGNTNTFTIDAYSPLWRLKRRYVHELLDIHQVDQSQIAWQLIAYTNARNPTGIQAGQMPASVLRDRTYDISQNIYDAVADFYNIGGFDPDVRYVHSESDPTLALYGTMPVKGVWQPHARMDYHTGLANCDDMQRRWVIDENQPANDIRATGQGNDTYTPHAEVFDDPSISAITLLERFETFDNVNQVDTLTAYASELLKAVRLPVPIVQPTLSPVTGPQYGRDFFLGDVLPCSASRGRMQFSNVKQRVYEVELQLTSSEVEQTTPTLADDLSGTVVVPA
jgi:hypothetical protein